MSYNILSYYPTFSILDEVLSSGNYKNLNEVAENLSRRLSNIFLKNNEGKRAFNGNVDKFNNDDHFKNYIMFHEYFNGDTGEGIGASHQTGWTATIAKLIQPRMGSRPR